MKKIHLWIVVPLFVLGFIAFQWIGASNEKRRLEAGIAKLEHDLQMIANAQANQTGYYPKLSQKTLP